MEIISELAAALDTLDEGRLLIITGAGISLASGISTFRGNDPDAIWTRDLTEMATRRHFEADPVGAWTWYLDRFESVRTARPNPAHAAVADLERWHVDRGGDFLLVTQNIDTLHEQAGSSRLVKVHGSVDRVRCSRTGCGHGPPSGSLPRDDYDLTRLVAEPEPDNLPECPACGTVLRPHVLLFDEYYDEHDDYEIERVDRFVRAMDCALFVGTSLSVGVTELVIHTAVRRRIPAFHIDPATTPHMAPTMRHLSARAEQLLPELCSALGAS